MASHFRDGNVIILTSVASGKDLCAPPNSNGAVLGKGIGGKFARWVVQREGPNVRLAKFTDRKSYLRINNDRLDAEGGEGPWTLFHVVEHKGKANVVSLASVGHAGQHVGILESGDAKAPSKTKTGKHGQFIVKEPMAGGALFSNGNVIRLTSVATGKNLRIHPNGTVDGEGGDGDLAKFVVHDAGHGHVRLSAFADRKKYLRIQPDGDLDGQGGEGEWTLLQPVKKGPKLFVLKSVKNPSWHVGILPNGNAKNGKMTGEGEHGQFRVSKA